MKHPNVKNLIKCCWELHDAVDSNYISPPVKKGDEKWLDKQRILLTDMAIQLLQTAVEPGDINLHKFTNNLNAILTRSNQFLPKAELKKAIDKLFLPAT